MSFSLGPQQVGSDAFAAMKNSFRDCLSETVLIIVSPNSKNLVFPAFLKRVLCVQKSQILAVVRYAGFSLGFPYSAVFPPAT